MNNWKWAFVLAAVSSPENYVKEKDWSGLRKWVMMPGLFRGYLGSTLPEKRLVKLCQNVWWPHFHSDSTDLDGCDKPVTAPLLPLHCTFTVSDEANAHRPDRNIWGSLFIPKQKSNGVLYVTQAELVFSPDHGSKPDLWLCSAPYSSLFLEWLKSRSTHLT